ncbi:MAG: GFA family protein [Hyphomonas sp.]|uniref:GFA family protein n=1 Tax=Hyphomonas sp. TaxID=87 RepID=UPI0034A05C7D
MRRLQAAGGGGPYGLYLHVARGALEIRGGARDRFVRTGGSGNAIPIERCAACGTRRWHLPEVAPDLVILCAGTLDDSRWAIPTSHIFIEFAAADAVAAEYAIAVEGFQTTRPALWEKFSEIYH